MNLYPLIPKAAKVGLMPLDEAELQLLKNAEISKNGSFDVPLLNNAVLDFETSAAANIWVYNNTDDLRNDDLDGFYLSDDDCKKVMKEQAVVRYSIGAKLRAKAGGSIKEILGFEIGANRELDVSMYRLHDLSTKTSEAVYQDLLDFKSLLNDSAKAEFWDGFLPNEACSYALKGQVSGKIDVDVVQLLSTVLAPVFTLTKSGTQLPVSIDPSISVSFSFKREDNFECLVRKVEDKVFALKLGKAKSSSKELGINAGVSIESLDVEKEKIIQIIDKYYENYLGKPTGELDELIAQTDDYLSDETIATIIEKIDFVGDTYEELKAHYNEYKDKIADVKEKVIALLSAKVEIGLEYEYRKTMTTGVLLEATVQQDFLMANFGDVVKLKVASLLVHHRDADDAPFKVNNYFSEKGLEFSRRFALGLSIGNWTLSSYTQKELEVEEKEIGVNGKKAISISSLKEKGAFVFAEQSKIAISLDAETKHPAQELHYDDLDYTLTLIAGKEDGKIKGRIKERKNKKKGDVKDLNAFIQLAVVWGALADLSHTDSQKRLSELWNKIKHCDDVEYECKLHVPSEVFVCLANAMRSSMGYEILARSMAASVYENKNEDSARMASREDFYYQPILDFYNTRSTNNLFAHNKYRRSYKKWRNFETNRLSLNPVNRPSYFGGIPFDESLKSYQELLKAFNNFDEKISKSKALKIDVDHARKSEIAKLFGFIESVVNDKRGFNQKWFGYMILELIEMHYPDKADAISCTFTIQTTTGNKDEALVFGA
ncbi:hypothetical protein KDU71_18920 [Carboxylicivirga sediminis]|uniref:Uncharacterized protein n=1 Tax=Carboxylicivirga sediminis TaxID=2006564 RepID=A0A941FAM7_9BACT|nr:hypothetical protein [Carboxylicivirga sediminis]MBR8537650.1 hypothetical protein [Carboxylicivirga sediminis]